TLLTPTSSLALALNVAVPLRVELAAGAVNVAVGGLSGAAAAAWLMLKVCPPIEMEPLRELVIVFAATVKDTVPLPVPLVGGLMVIQLCAVEADHGQVEALAVTFTLLEPPAAGIDALLAERL